MWRPTLPWLPLSVKGQVAVPFRPLSQTKKKSIPSLFIIIPCGEWLSVSVTFGLGLIFDEQLFWRLGFELGTDLEFKSGSRSALVRGDDF